jgi:hypothetical protein
MRRFLVLVCVLVVSGCGLLRGGPPSDPETVAEALATAEPEEAVFVQGEISLLGELFCPCFVISSGGASAVVWYDLMADGDVSHDPVDVSGFTNGDVVRVEADVRPDQDPGTGLAVLWAFRIEPME